MAEPDSSEKFLKTLGLGSEKKREGEDPTEAFLKTLGLGPEPEEPSYLEAAKVGLKGGLAGAMKMFEIPSRAIEKLTGGAVKPSWYASEYLEPTQEEQERVAQLGIPGQVVSGVAQLPGAALKYMPLMRGAGLAAKGLGFLGKAATKLGAGEKLAKVIPTMGAAAGIFPAERAAEEVTHGEPVKAMPLIEESIIGAIFGGIEPLGRAARAAILGGTFSTQAFGETYAQTHDVNESLKAAIAPGIIGTGLGLLGKGKEKERPIPPTTTPEGEWQGPMQQFPVAPRGPRPYFGGGGGAVPMYQDANGVWRVWQPPEGELTYGIPEGPPPEAPPGTRGGGTWRYEKGKKGRGWYYDLGTEEKVGEPYVTPDWIKEGREFPPPQYPPTVWRPKGPVGPSEPIKGGPLAPTPAGKGKPLPIVVEGVSQDQIDNILDESRGAGGGIGMGLIRRLTGLGSKKAREILKKFQDIGYVEITDKGTYRLTDKVPNPIDRLRYVNDLRELRASLDITEEGPEAATSDFGSPGFDIRLWLSEHGGILTRKNRKGMVESPGMDMRAFRKFEGAKGAGKYWPFRKADSGQGQTFDNLFQELQGEGFQGDINEALQMLESAMTTTRPSVQRGWHGYHLATVRSAIDRGLRGESLTGTELSIWNEAKKEAKDTFRAKIHDKRMARRKTAQVPDWVTKEDAINELTSIEDDEIMDLKERLYEEGYTTEEINGYIEALGKRLETQAPTNPVEVEAAFNDELTKTVNLSPLAPRQYMLPGMRAGLPFGALPQGAPTLEGTPLAEGLPPEQLGLFGRERATLAEKLPGTPTVPETTVPGVPKNAWDMTPDEFPKWEETRPRRVSPVITPEGFSEEEMVRASTQNRALETTPPYVKPFPVGQWALDPAGELMQLREYSLDDPRLFFPEGMPNDSTTQKYVQWILQGQETPPISGVENVDGTIHISDGHHRAAALKYASSTGIAPKVKAWVSITRLFDPSYNYPEGYPRGVKPEEATRAQEPAPTKLPIVYGAPPEPGPEFSTPEEKPLEPEQGEVIKSDTPGLAIGNKCRVAGEPGIITGIEGTGRDIMLKIRMASFRDPKAFVRLRLEDVEPYEEPTVSFAKGGNEIITKGKLQFDERLLDVLGSSMYSQNLAYVTAKELTQNAFDTVKEAQYKGILKSTGTVKIDLDQGLRTIEITDNGMGMDPDTVQNAFFTIGGSKKDVPFELRSGGLGMAKMAFQIGSEWIEVVTRKDGVQTTVKASSDQIKRGTFDIRQKQIPPNQHGTKVTVKIPEDFTDPKTGEKKELWFPYNLESITFFEKPLLGDVEIIETRAGQAKTLPIGKHQNLSKIPLLTKSHFSWGDADIYVGIERKDPQAWGKKAPLHEVLSSGIHQFSTRFVKDPRTHEAIPFDVIVDLKPKVDPTHPDYPFTNDREKFRERIKPDITALQTYLADIAMGKEAQTLKDEYQNVTALPRVGFERGEALSPEEWAKHEKEWEEWKKGFEEREKNREPLPAPPKDITIQKKEGESESSILDALGKVLTPSQKERIKEATFKAEKAAPAWEQFLQKNEIDPAKPIFHNNTNIDFLRLWEGVKGNPQEFFAQLGSLFAEMKETLAKSDVYGMTELEKNFFTGISIDKSYGGVHIKVPYGAVFINPLEDISSSKTAFGLAETILTYMTHELGHTGAMSHGVAHNQQQMRARAYLADQGLLDYFSGVLKSIVIKNWPLIKEMRRVYEESSTRNTGTSFKSSEVSKIEHEPGPLFGGLREGGHAEELGAGLPQALSAGARRGKPSPLQRDLFGGLRSKEPERRGEIIEPPVTPELSPTEKGQYKLPGIKVGVKFGEKKADLPIMEEKPPLLGAAEEAARKEREAKEPSLFEKPKPPTQQFNVGDKVYSGDFKGIVRNIEPDGIIQIESPDGKVIDASPEKVIRDRPYNENGLIRTTIVNGHAIYGGGPGNHGGDVDLWQKKYGGMPPDAKVDIGWTKLSEWDPSDPYKGFITNDQAARYVDEQIKNTTIPESPPIDYKDPKAFRKFVESKGKEWPPSGSEAEQLRAEFDAGRPGAPDKMGRAWVREKGRENLRYFTSSEEITRGKKKGKVKITLTDGTEKIVDKDDIQKPKGGAEFRLGEGPQEPLEREAVKGFADEYFKNKKGAPDVEIIDLADIPEHMTEGLRENLRKGIKGFYDPKSKKIYVIRDMVESERDLLSTLEHEAVGHYATETILGPDGEPFFQKVYLKYGTKGLKDIADQRGFDLNTPEGRLNAAREKIAELSETRENPGLLRQFYAWIRTQLRKIFPTLKLADSEIDMVLKKARAFLASGEERARQANDNILKSYISTGASADRPIMFSLKQQAKDIGRAAYTEEIRPKWEGIKDTWKWIKEHFAPLIGVTPKNIDAMMKMKGERELAQTIVELRTEKGMAAMNRLTRDQQIDFIDKIQQGDIYNLPPELKEVERLHRLIEDDLWQMANAVLNQMDEPGRIAYLENHVRNFWKVLPADALDDVVRKGFSGLWRRPLEGTRSSLFHQYWTLKEGMEHGGVPFTTNLMEITRMNYADTMKLVTAQKMWQHLLDNGDRKFIKFGEVIPEGFVPLNDRIANRFFPTANPKITIDTPHGPIRVTQYEADLRRTAMSDPDPIKRAEAAATLNRFAQGWRPKDWGRGRWVVEENVGRLLQNYLSRDIIRETPALRGLMGIKNITTALELGFSAFHAVFETIEAAASQMGVGFRKIWNQKAVGEGLKDILTAPKAASDFFRIGKDWYRVMKDPQAFFATARGQKFLRQFPEAVDDINWLYWGGGSMRMNESYKINSVNTFRENLNSKNYVGAALRSIPALRQFMMKPLFEIYIPGLKRGMFLKEFNFAKVERANDLLSGKITKAGLAREVWRSVEDRFGEMNFDNLWWDRTFKSSLQLVIRSVTWKLGNIRQFGEAITGQSAELLDAAKARRLPRLTQEMAWAWGVVSLTTAMAYVTQKAFTGKDPENWKDLVYPQIDNQGGRISLPTYLRDFFHLKHSPLKYVGSSMAGWFWRINEVLNNKDFYGVQVHDPNENAVMQSIDSLVHMVPLPFSFQSFKRMKEEGEEPSRQVIGFLGGTKAPYWIERTSAEQKASELKAAHLPVGGRTAADFKRGQLLKNYARLYNEAKLKGGSTDEIMSHLNEDIRSGNLYVSDLLRFRERIRGEPLETSVMHLPFKDVYEVYKVGTDAEKKKLYPVLMRKFVGLRNQEDRILYYPKIQQIKSEFGGVQ